MICEFGLSKIKNHNHNLQAFKTVQKERIASLEIALADEVDSLLIFKFNLNKFSDFGVDIWKFWDVVQYSLKFAWEVLTGFVSCSGDMAFKFDCVLSKSKNLKKPVRYSPVDAW